MSARSRILAAGALFASALLLTACGGGETPPAAEPTEPPAASAPETAPESSEAAPDAPAGDVTAPGTVLAIGDTATVDYENNSGDVGRIGLTVTRIEKGSAADLADLDLGSTLEGMTPYFLYVTVSAVDDTSANLERLSPRGDFDGLLADGSKAQDLVLIGSWDRCPGGTGPAEFRPGDSFEACTVVLSSGPDVVSVAFKPSKGEYFDNPIVWK